MSKIHVLERGQDGAYRGVTHFLVPTGNNTAGVSWKAVALAVSPTPQPAAFDDATEQASIIAGDIIEVPWSLITEVGKYTAPQLLAQAAAQADAAKAMWVKDMLFRCDRYGTKLGTVS